MAEQKMGRDGVSREVDSPEIAMWATLLGSGATSVLRSPAEPEAEGPSRSALLLKVGAGDQEYDFLIIGKTVHEEGFDVKRKAIAREAELAKVDCIHD